MKHIFIKKDLNNVIVLLHGTGSNENEFLQIGEVIDSSSSILSIRGNVNENGMNRFFERYGMGLYNIESYEDETENLYETIVNASKEYGFNLEDVTIAGFSNGANIALGLIQDYPGFVNNYILLSPDYINKEKGFNDLSNLNIFISTAKDDPYINNLNVENMISQMNEHGANLNIYVGKGHQITYQILEEATKWYLPLKR